MFRSSAKGLNALLVSVSACLLLASSALYGATTSEKKSAPKVTPKVLFPRESKVTGLHPLRSHLKRPVPGATRKEIPIQPLKRANPDYTATGPALPRTSPSPQMPDPLVTFEGVGDVNFVQPADTTLAIGPDHVFQWVNLSAEIFDKTGNDLSGGPFDGTAFWQDLGGDCAEINGGDVIVIYDHLADRWIATQIAPEIFGASTNNVCWAVSTTSDPLGTYYQYAFDYGGDLNDYPKWALWPDAYYGTFRNFVASNFFSGMVVWAVDRNAVLAGAPDPTILSVDVGEVLPNLDGLLAANLSPGDTGPPLAARTGAPIPPETLFGVSNPGLDGDPSAIRIFQFHPDFGNPPASTFSGPVDLPVADFTPSTGSVEQPPPGGSLEDLPWIMYKADYRNFGTYEGVVLTHTEDVGGGQIGVRWYEVRDPRGTPVLHQQGSLAPDSSNRWFPSIAQDFVGDIAVGYSVADGSIFPSIRYAGRFPGDPLGQLAQGEGEFFAGNGSFGGFRWGDYSTISLDPTDQCTFWYTTMYVPGSGLADWGTGIGSFKFPSCTTGPRGTISGTVTDGTNPLAGVKVSAGLSSATTDVSGAYSMELPTGTYDLTASKYGYLPGSANGVVVTEDNTTVVNFTLETAPSTEVNGTVKDGSGGGWPLYATIKITAPGAPTFNLATDPVTGYYSIVLVEGITYTFQIKAVSKGYLPGGGTLDLSATLHAAGAVVKNWELFVDADVCTAPGYTPTLIGLSEDFEGGALPEGWSITNDSIDGGGTWSIHLGGDPCGHGAFSGNQTGGTGYYALVDSDCDGLVTDDTSLITPSVDLSSFTTARLRFNTDYNNLGDVADVDISTDGGTSWTNVWRKTSDVPGPSLQSIDITPIAAGQANVKARFHYYEAFFAWWWQVDNVFLGNATCNPSAGGLVVGKVTSLASGLGLNGAKVKNLPDDAETFTFHSPSEGDGFYILFAPSGSQQFEASLNLYASAQATKVVVPGSTQRLDFALKSGVLSVAPLALNGRVDPSGSQTQPFTVTNTGTVAANFEFLEINAPILHSVTHGFASDAQRQAALARLPEGKDGKMHTALTARGLAAPKDLPHALDRLLAAGDVLSSFDSGLAIGWGVATAGTDVWIANPSYIGGGDDNDHRFTPDGTDTGDVISEDGVGLWAADGAFNPTTGKYWRVAVGGDNCLYEFDPATLSQTGNTICGSPWTGISQRGLAYDAGSNTFFVGGWNEMIVYHINTDGDVLDSKDVGLPIAGLAYSASNGHLLVMSNQPAGPDVTVLDALDNYNVLGSFQVVDNGSPVFGDFEQAGMEFDCTGNLWAINQATQVVYRIDAGEAGSCEVDIPWFSVDPTEGSVNPNGGTFPVTAAWDSGNLLPGLYQAQLLSKTDTPTGIPPIPVTLTVRFLDVPDGNQFEAYIYGAAGAGVMFGGPPVCPAGVLNFCPAGVVTRADMAGYLWRAINGRNAAPPVYQNVFTDVTFNDYNAFYIQGIYDLGITAGCGTNVYCPNNINTRAQMSVFIVKAAEGSDFVPPPCTGLFDDVPCPGGFAVDYIEYLFNQNVTAGCGGGNFCPNANISNGQMAVFLVKAFNIPHL